LGALEQLHTTLVNEIERRRLLEQEVLDGRGALTRLLADRAGIRDPERDALRPASHDSLTSLPNRDHFRDRLDRAMVRAEERREALAVLYLDLDVAIPAEERGDAEPDDQLLRIVATRLTGMVRAEDTLGRVGGDEFACMLVNAPGRELLSHLACKLLRAVSAPMTIGEATLSVRPSIGIAIGPDDGATAETLLEIADAAMQRAKWQRTGYAFCDTRAEVWARQFVRF
jgi:diguanylate cyclase (GGDEF)-like protein